MNDATRSEPAALFDAGIDPLGGSVADFHGLGGAHLLDRWLGHQAWWDARLAAEVDPYCKALEGAPGALAVEIAAVDLKLEQTELRFLEEIRDRLDLDRLVTAAIEAAARARYRHA